MKKTELIMFAGILMVLSLTGCAPRVLTEVTMNYPARSVDEVRVYDVGDTVPNSAVAIGKVAVLDRGFTTNCGYDRMLGLAKERTAENGGNGLLLTEHNEPNFWGSSCHQLMGTMFLMTDTIIDTTKPNVMMDGVKRDAEVKAQELKERSVPKNSIRLSFGPSWITSDVETFKGTKHPFGWEATLDYEHVWSSGLGVGINTALYRTSYTEKDDGINGNMTLFYVGPSILYAFKIDKHWRLGYAFGIGYAYVDDLGFQQSGVGFMGKVSIEYQLNDQWGLGLGLNGHGGNFKKPEGVELRENERWGIGRVGLLLGARYYF